LVDVRKILQAFQKKMLRTNKSKRYAPTTPNLAGFYATMYPSLKKEAQIF